MSHWLDTLVGQEFLKKAFEAAGMPEVEEKDLEPGTYTNRQIAEKVGDAVKLTGMLMSLPGDDPASKRAILSFMVEME